jgi:hypothetical protein
MDTICMRLAWDAEFIKRMREKDSSLEGLDDAAVFYKWSNSYKAEWPSLLVEPESEQVKVADVKLRAMVAVVQVLMPLLKGEQLAETINWLQANLNEMRLLFGNPLNLDPDQVALDAEEAEARARELTAMGEPQQPKPFSHADSAEKAIAAFKDAMSALNKEPKRKLELVR